MTRWLLLHVSTVGIVLLFAIGASMLSVVGFALTERFYPRLRKGSFPQATGSVGTAFTLLFGLILALTIAGLTSNASTASSTVSDESTALSQLTRAAQAFNPQTRAEFKAAIDQYDHAVADDEFLTMQRGEQSPLAAAALANLYAVYLGYTPKSNETDEYGSSLSKLDTLTSVRRTRIQESQTSVSPLLQIVLMLGTIAFVILNYPSNIDKKGVRLLVIGAIAAFVAFVFALTIILDYPFSGQVAVSNAPYKDGALAQYWPSI